MGKLIIGTIAASWLVVLASVAVASDVVQLTDNGTRDARPAISGSTVVWAGFDGNDLEIYMTNIAGPTSIPSTSVAGLALLAGMLLGVAAWARRRS